MTKKNKIPLKPYYSFPFRLLIEFYNEGKLPAVHSLDVEPEYGRAGRIVYKDGSVRLFYSNGLGINSNDSSSIVKDKGYTKFFLNKLGYITPVGKVFIMPQKKQKIDINLSAYGFNDYPEVHTIYSYIDTVIGYPCFIKPNEGTKGINVFKCFNSSDVQSVIVKYEKECIEVLLVEQYAALPDYRVNVLGDQIICCYLRKPLSVTGDGKLTIKELLVQKQDRLKSEGKSVIIKMDDPRLFDTLTRNTLSFDTVLPLHEVLVILDYSNLPSGGEAYDYTDKIHPKWKELCMNVTKEMGLLISGIDILCADMEDPHARYSILEINSSPILRNYAALGQKQEETVRSLYMKLFNISTPDYKSVINIL